MHVNWLAVIVAAVSAFMLGGLWYSKALFLKQWLADSGMVEQHGHPVRTFGVSFVFALVSAYLFARCLPAGASPRYAMLEGLVIGAGFVAASFGINYSFANRPWRMWLIDGGYHTLQFVLYGVIIGFWR